MLSYQHAYHAGNPADVHKHALLAWMLNYLIRKDKPLTYIETHAGRALYDLGSDEALKTGEAAAGVTRLAPRLPPDHPYRKVLETLRKTEGPAAYPGSPLIAARLLRPGDALHLAELHPAEHAALSGALSDWENVQIHHRDGFELAQSLCPPTPRRGLLLCDPSWEVKRDYDDIPLQFEQLAKKWNVGVLTLWYPILESGAHRPMLARLARSFPDALRHEVAFPPVRPGHGMRGSGLFVVNPPYGLAAAAETLAPLFPGRTRPKR